eukprot:NODE_5420_length_656_cov_79.546314_g5257_i0.p1 GENE.NODE_5420_length_656_cov_79.546314_g5257_i0~~NODE_5420_length_656_cov_79.546314_g5257_i0.p1  ORF type:complete len:159 (-),score=37.19 NODE_5420_length_656_cov_79.546314_g5257_i0:120-596(-)
MADHETGEYETSGAGASTTFPMQCGALKKNGYVCIKGRPGKIIDYSTSKTGKHGHAKAHIIAIDIFTGKKMEELCPTSHNMDVPNVSRVDYQLADINGEVVTLLDPDTMEEKSDINMPEGDLGALMLRQFEEGKDLVISVIKAMGEEAIVGCKEASGS